MRPGKGAANFVLPIYGQLEPIWESTINIILSKIDELNMNSWTEVSINRVLVESRRRNEQNKRVCT